MLAGLSKKLGALAVLKAGGWVLLRHTQNGGDWSKTKLALIEDAKKLVETGVKWAQNAADFARAQMMIHESVDTIDNAETVKEALQALRSLESQLPDSKAEKKQSIMERASLRAVARIGPLLLDINGIDDSEQALRNIYTALFLFGCTGSKLGPGDRATTIDVLASIHDQTGGDKALVQKLRNFDTANPLPLAGAIGDIAQVSSITKATGPMAPYYVIVALGANMDKVSLPDSLTTVLFTCFPEERSSKERAA